MPASIEQAPVIIHPLDRHGTVLAVAGSGKSFTMKEMISHMIEARRVPPEKIIAVMFNQSASKQFAEGLVSRLGLRNAPDSVTFHRLGTLTLKRLIKNGMAEDWTFSGQPADSQYFAMRLIEDTCHKYGFQYPRLIADVFLGFIDRVKGDLQTPAETWANGDWDKKYEWFVDMYAHYERVRAKKGVRFFSDLIYDPVRIMAENPAAAEFIAGKYRHIVLDEYQDICESQQALIRFVAGKSTQVMVVGDDDQTIYTWRGAKPSYILTDFDRDFPGGITYRLTRTWRYGHILSCAANYVITHNTVRADKLCISSEGTPNTQVKIEFEDTEGKKLTSLVQAWIKKGRKLSEIAILIRTYSRSGISQFALLQGGVPFRLEGGDDASVLDNRWVSALIGWMRVAAGIVCARPYAGEPDSGSVWELRKILDSPSLGLSRDGIALLCAEVLKKPNEMEGFVHFVRVGLTHKEGGLSEKILQRGKLWKKIRSLTPSRGSINAFVLADQLVSALGIKDAIYKLSKNEDDAEDQWSLVEAFLSYVKTNHKGSLLAFLNHIDDLKTFSDKAKKATDAINMTSVHRSKGLEYPCVIMIGLHQGGFPHKPKKALDPDKEWLRIEDERRLFYVAMTRAQEELWMLCPPDNGLTLWHRAGKSGKPPHMKYDQSIASQFLYECNLTLCQLLPAFIKGTIPSLKAGDPEVYNAYLAELGIERRVEKITQQDGNT